MGNRFSVALASAALAGLFACVGARGQTKKQPCHDSKDDAAKYAECMDAYALGRAFHTVLGRPPTAAEVLMWKKALVVGGKGLGVNKYTAVLLEWLYRPERAGEQAAVVDRAFKAYPDFKPESEQRAYWEKAGRAGKLTFSQIVAGLTPDLALVGTVPYPGNPHALLVRVANKGQWAGTKPARLLLFVHKSRCDEYPLDEINDFDVPPLPAGKEAQVRVLSKFTLHAKHPAYQLKLMPGGPDAESANDGKCVEPLLQRQGPLPGANTIRKVPPPLKHN